LYRRQCRREQQLEALMNNIDTREAAATRLPTQDIDDSHKVRMGSMSPSFPAVQRTAVSFADTGKIRTGSLSPSFPPARATPSDVVDNGKV
jgi:hypothetical protein